jgi:plastocyanin
LTSKIKALALTAGAAALLPAAAAHAATKTVTMGEPAKFAKKFENKYSSDVNDFFPHGVKIHVGDKLRFVPVGFHTADFPAKGAGALPLATPTGQKATGVNDQAGAPFWFNGQDLLQFNPALGKGLFGKTASYNGSKRVKSGLPLSNKPKPFTVKFTKTGGFTYYCNVHPGMKGKVTVVAKSKPVPTAKSDAAVVSRMVKRDIKYAKAAAKATVPAGKVDVGSSGSHGVDYYGFLPGTVTINHGASLTFRMTAGSLEDHTATTAQGPNDPNTNPSSYLGQLSQGFQGNAPLDPRGTYPSDPAGTPANLSPTYHGNGFWNTGVMDNSSATPFPGSGTVTFAQPGTYEFYCLIHPFMHGTVIVK